MNIVITGSTGHISKPLIEKLVHAGHAVTVVSSNPQRAMQITNLGATPAFGLVEDVTFMTELMTGSDAVYCMTPPNFSEQEQVAYYERIADRYAQAIRKSGIKRVVYLSSYGAHLPSGTGFIRGSHRAEKILNSITGVARTHIRPTFFYYNLLGFVGMIKKAGFIGAVYGGEDKLAMVSPADIAGAIAGEITKRNSLSGVLYVSSDDRTCNEVAQVLGKAIGKPDLTWKVLPPEKVLQSLVENGIPHNAAENLVELGTAIHTGALREDFEKHQPVFGTIKLEDFATEFAAAYNQETLQDHQ